MKLLRLPAPRAATGLALFLLAAASVWICHLLVFAPMPGPGGAVQWRFHNLIFDSHERLHYVIRLSELHDALTHGQWIVRWCRNLEGGYGYPFFGFYAPLSYYLAEVWHLAGLDLFLAWKAHFLLMTWLSGGAVYLFARLFHGRLASTVAALLYLLAPYHILNLYVRGNVAEFTAMTVLPWLLYFTQRLILGRGSEAANRCGTALSAAALILTHNLTAFFGGLFVAGWCAVWLIRERKSFPLVEVLLSGAAGVLMSAFFWLPMVLEMKFTHFEVMDHTFRAAPSHTVAWWQYFTNSWGFGNSLPGTDDRMSFAVGWPQWLGVVWTLSMLASKRERSPRARVAVLMTLSLLMLLLLASSLVAPLWKLPVLSAIQFPWRLLAIASLCSAVAGAHGVDALRERAPRAGLAAAGALVAALIILSVPKIRVLSWFPNEASVYRPENTRRVFTNTNIGEFRPVWVRELPPGDDGSPLLSRRRVLGGDGLPVYQAPPAQATSLRFRHKSGGEGENLIYEMFYFPGWKATVDGQPLEIGPLEETGLIRVRALPGEHEYRIWLGWSPARTAGFALSGAGLLLLLLRMKTRGRR